MRDYRILVAVGFVALLVAISGTGLALLPGQGEACAAPAIRPAMQGVQASGFITLGGGTCFPDAVLTDCDGIVTEQLKGPGGAGFFAPYIGMWVDLTGVRRTCPAGDTYIDVVTIQPTTSPCATPTPGGPTPTPGGPTATPPPATATPVGPTPTPGGVVDVAVRDNYFDPASLNIPVGTTVRWTNLGLNSHSSTSDTGLWDSGTMSPGASFNFTFATPGTYPYHDIFHGALGMTGTIIVGAAPAQTPTPAAPGNLALGKPIQASSSEPPGQPAYAVDGNPTTFWASSPGYNPNAPAQNVQWIHVDLQNVYSVQSMHMTWGHWRHARTYAIYAWIERYGGWCIIASTRSGDGDDTATFPEAVDAQYWMLWLVNPYLIGGHYELTEWEVFGSSSVPPQSANVSAGKPAVAHSHQPGYEAAKASDADLATEWRAATLPTWIYVDLMATEEIDRAVIRWTPGQHASDYTLYAWNGWNWVPFYTKSGGSGGDETIVFGTVRTRYVLIYATAGPAGVVGIREFEIYRSSSGGLPTPLLEGGWGPELEQGLEDVVPAGARATAASIAPGAVAELYSETVSGLHLAPERLLEPGGALQADPSLAASLAVTSRRSRQLTLPSPLIER